MGHVKTVDGYDVKVPSQGQVNYNTVAGSIGLASAVLGNGFLGGLFGNRQPQCVNSDDECVNRYELRMEKELAAKDSEIALLKANTYQDQKTLELYKYVDGKFATIEATLAGQAVRNQAFNDALAATDFKFTQAIALEAERRECADCKIVNYANSTFAPKLITDYTAGTTSAAAVTYNPLACGCGCK